MELTEEYMGTVRAKDGVLSVSDPKDTTSLILNEATKDVKSSYDGYAVMNSPKVSLVAFQTAWKDAEYDAFAYKDTKGDIVEVRLRLKED